MATLDLETLSVRLRDGMCVISLDRPGELNAMSNVMAADFTAALDVAASARAVVLTGTDKVFSVGWDMRETGKEPPEPGWESLVERLFALPVTTVAAIEGYCLGGGLALALACDLRVASTSARLALPEIHRGFVAGMACSWRLPRLVGPSRAKRMLLLGHQVDGATAERWALVDELAEPGQALAVAEGLARLLAAGPPIAQRVVKALVNDNETRTLAEAIAAEASAARETEDSEDAKEGVAAFFDKRSPQFHGR